MKIEPLPVFDADADPRHRDAMTDQERYDRLEPPKSIVVKFGAMKLVGEFPYDGDAKPGCGSKLVCRTHRGTEIAEMLTTTCENAGCSKSITRQEMLDYIDNSGGKDYPFHTNGKILRLATIEDLNRQSELQGDKSEYIRTCKQLITKHNLDMKLVEVEPILGRELLTFYYMAEDRVDFRALVRELAAEFKTRIDLRQVGARDEARLVADYERCGLHCCCKTFLKVLRPVSMRSAKMQKATLDPLKISGRCGRLMCCLRYEDQTYKDLKKNLPHRKSRVGTQFGPGIVLDSKILVQLVLVKIEETNEEVAIPVEELMDPETCPRPGEVPSAQQKKVAEMLDDPLRGLGEKDVEKRTDDGKKGLRGDRRRRRSRGEKQDAHRKASIAEEARVKDPSDTPREAAPDSSPAPKKRRRRRKGRGSRDLGDRPQTDKPQDARPDPVIESGEAKSDAGPKSRRRKRKRRGPRGGPKGGEGGGAPPPAGD